jgi:hypothetical protein
MEASQQFDIRPRALFSPKETDFVPILKVLGYEDVGITDLAGCGALSIEGRLSKVSERWVAHRRRYPRPLYIATSHKYMSKVWLKLE